MNTTEVYKNTNCTKWNRETGTVVACALEADEFFPNPTPSTAYGTWESADRSILKGLASLFIRSGVHYYGTYRMFPYLPPAKVKTEKRCQFLVFGRRCRCVGHYVLTGKHYCASHYDAAWKVANPIIGQQHAWHVRVNRTTGDPDKYETCGRCGSIKVYDGLPQSPCKGSMPKIVLW